MLRRIYPDGSGGMADILLANFEDSPALSGKLAIAVMNSLPDARGFFLFK
jgi:hypothetical protein